MVGSFVLTQSIASVPVGSKVHYHSCSHPSILPKADQTTHPDYWTCIARTDVGLLAIIGQCRSYVRLHTHRVLGSNDKPVPVLTCFHPFAEPGLRLFLQHRRLGGQQADYLQLDKTWLTFW
jgi:hypothetical protein